MSEFHEYPKWVMGEIVQTEAEEITRLGIASDAEKPRNKGGRPRKNPLIAEPEAPGQDDDSQDASPSDVD